MMMELVCTPEMSVYFFKITRSHIPEGFLLQTMKILTLVKAMFGDFRLSCPISMLDK